MRTCERQLLFLRSVQVQERQYSLSPIFLSSARLTSSHHVPYCQRVLVGALDRADFRCKHGRHQSCIEPASRQRVCASVAKGVRPRPYTRYHSVLCLSCLPQTRAPPRPPDQPRAAALPYTHTHTHTHLFAFFTPARQRFFSPNRCFFFIYPKEQYSPATFLTPPTA